MSNFIEIWYGGEDYRQNWIATRSVLEFDGAGGFSDWQIDGSTLHVTSRDDIEALRLLLDEIEKELSE